MVNHTFRASALPFLDFTPKQQRIINAYLQKFGKRDFRAVCTAVGIPADLPIGRFSRSQAAAVIGAFKMMESDHDHTR